MSSKVKDGAMKGNCLESFVDTQVMNKSANAAVHLDNRMNPQSHTFHTVLRFSHPGPFQAARYHSLQFQNFLQDPSPLQAEIRFNEL